MTLDTATLEKLAKVGLRVVRPVPDGPHTTIPLFVSKVAAGLPSFSDDGAEDAIDLHSHCVPHPEHSYLLRVSGSSMQGVGTPLGVGIQDDDLLVVDRSIPPKDGHIVIASLDGELTVKRMRHKGRQVMLVPENPDYPTIAVRPDQDFRVLGVVTFVIHAV